MDFLDPITFLQFSYWVINKHLKLYNQLAFKQHRAKIRSFTLEVNTEVENKLYPNALNFLT